MRARPMTVRAGGSGGRQWEPQNRGRRRTRGSDRFIRVAWEISRSLIEDDLVTTTTTPISRRRRRQTTIACPTIFGLRALNNSTTASLPANQASPGATVTVPPLDPAQTTTTTTPPPTATMSSYLESFSKWIQLKIYQLEITYSVYIFTPIEKFIFCMSPRSTSPLPLLFPPC